VQPAASLRLGDLRMNVPALWSVRRLDYRCLRLGAGVLVSNLDRTALAAVRRDLEDLPPGSCTNVWDVSALPPSFLMLDVSQFRPPVSVPKTRFPLSESFFVPSGVTDARGRPLACRCSARSNLISAGKTYDVRIWIGDHASEVDRRRMACLVASIRPKKAPNAAPPNCAFLRSSD
jgi:hypothetical protein